jgi:hypothetical protein
MTDIGSIKAKHSITRGQPLKCTGVSLKNMPSSRCESAT